MHQVLREHGFTILLGTIVAFIGSIPTLHVLGKIVHPLLESIVILAVFMGMLLAMAVVTAQSRRSRRLTWSLAAACLFTLTLDRSTPGVMTTVVISHLCWLALMACSLWLSISFLFRTRRVTLNIVSASLCVYILLGFMWVGLYSLESMLLPEAFTVPLGFEIGRYTVMIDTFYFSFVTMTTLGYGDIVPVLPSAKIMALLQAVIGQLFLVVLVARFVGMHTAQMKWQD